MEAGLGKEYMDVAIHESSLADQNPPKSPRNVRDEDSIHTTVQCGSEQSVLTFFFSLLTAQYRRLIAGLAALAIGVSLKLVPPAAIKFIFDYALGDAPRPWYVPPWVPLPENRAHLLVGIATVLVFVSIIECGISFLGHALIERIAKCVDARLRTMVLSHTLRLPIHAIQDVRTGGIVSVLRNDVNCPSHIINGAITQAWIASLNLAGATIILALVDWRLFLGLSLLLPAAYGFKRFWRNYIYPVLCAIRNEQQEVDAHLTEVYAGIRVVRSFGKHADEARKITRMSNSILRKEMTVWWLGRLIGAGWGVVTPIMVSAGLCYGGLQVLAGTLSLGDVMMFLAFFTMLIAPVNALKNAFSDAQDKFTGLERVMRLLAKPAEQASAKLAKKVARSNVAGHVILRDVTLQYPGSSEVALSGVNLEVQPGETIAFVGESGAGKSTLCNLIARFYEPTSGSIHLDGVDVQELDLQSYRQLLGIVDQDVFLFHGSVSENIAYGKKSASAYEIHRAAKLARAHEFISAFPDGYDTLIGERGVRLSGGQRQRLAIARAIVADPAILILDEATSNLDSANEKMVQQSLVEVMKDRTCFVVAHRLSTITNADRICIVEAGRIIQSGTHRELLSSSHRYRDMVAIQKAA